MGSVVTEGIGEPNQLSGVVGQWEQMLYAQTDSLCLPFILSSRQVPKGQRGEDVIGAAWMYPVQRHIDPLS